LAEGVMAYVPPAQREAQAARLQRMQQQQQQGAMVMMPVGDVCAALQACLSVSATGCWPAGWLAVAACPPRCPSVGRCLAGWRGCVGVTPRMPAIRR
jgi:hypothetical protein